MKHTKKCLETWREGHEEGQRLNLSIKENWSPLMIYIHQNALSCGCLLGTLFGAWLMIVILRWPF